jgi:hypothetical protein
LAPFAGAHDFVGVNDRSGPIKALAECIAHESVRRRVVATYARVDVSDKLAAVGDGDAPLQDTRLSVSGHLMLWSGEWARVSRARRVLEQGRDSSEGAPSPRARRRFARGGAETSSEAEIHPRGRGALERGVSSPEGGEAGCLVGR